MSKSGSSAGGKSGAGRRSRAASGGASGGTSHKSPAQHAELRRNGRPSATEDNRPLSAVQGGPGKSKSQQKKVAQQARAIAAKKAKKRK